MGEAFPIGGNIDPDSFPYLLANLHQQGATGSLKVEGAPFQKALYFRGGRILFGSSNDPRDQLGSILIDSGRLSEEQLEAANAKVGPGNPLAKVLADGGFVSQRDLGEAARAKVERILSDLLAMSAGSFEFEDDVLPKGAIDLKLPTPRLFVAALQRIEDPAFLERHLGGPRAVLRPVGGTAVRMAEIFAEVKGLPDVLDGHRRLDEAAGLAQMPIEEAQRLACALLLLGLIEKVPGAASGASAVFEAVDDSANELDLSQTARVALDPAGWSPTPVAALPEEPAPFVFEGLGPAVAPVIPPPAPAVEETVVMPRPTDVAAAGRPASPPSHTAPSPPELEPPAATMIVGHQPTSPPQPAPPAPPPKPALPGAATSLPLVPPPPRDRPLRRTAPKPAVTEPEPSLQHPPSPRPSRADLEAVDSLLKSKGLEHPLGGGVTGPRPAARPPAWEPNFGGPAARRQAANRRWLAWAAGGLALASAAGAAGWYFFVRPRPAPSMASSGPRPQPTPLAATPAPSLPVQPSAAASPTPAPVTAGPTAAEARPAPPPPSAAPPGRLATPEEARAALRQGDLGRAAQAFLANVKAAPRGSFSVQLLVACASETVGKALAQSQAPELFIVPVHYRGRDCWRVCWGLYEGRERAEQARRSIPPYFREGGASPKIVPAAEIVP